MYRNGVVFFKLTRYQGILLKPTLISRSSGVQQYISFIAGDIYG